MASLKTKVNHALDESRILVLGAQVLLGFLFETAFEPGFPQLDRISQRLLLAALCLMLSAVVLLIAPAPFHCIAERGQDTPRLHRYITTTTALALLPFALGLSVVLYIAVKRLGGTIGQSAAAGCGTALLCLFWWYGLEGLERARRGCGEKTMTQEEAWKGREKTGLEERIKQVLTEARVVLPGAQALFGFQFLIILMDAFQQLPAFAQVLHLISLSLVSISIILLMAPASYHRIVEQGNDSERFHRFASAMVLAAMIPLVFGACSDFLVFAFKATGSLSVATASASVLAVLFLTLWFGYPLYVRRRDRGPF